MSIVTRFAPSPTGDLHLGSVRTALYCWLFAKKNNGKLILRIEDTDLARSTQESIDVIIKGLTWLGLTWNEGPYFQSKRTNNYQKIAQQLLASDKAYYCSCSKERLEKLRSQQLANKQKPKYDGHCRNLKLINPNNNYTLRFKNPEDNIVSFNDLIRGPITVANQELDDFILLRQDGSPTYNFTVVVDDFEMQITDVVRGEDHISNTPKQINLLTALNAPIPNYAHIPMILGPDGTKLSKRHGASSILEYKKIGILPHALINSLARLGWAHKDQEIFTIEELIDLFEITAVHKSAAIFDVNKLLWLNHHYIANSNSQDLVRPVLKQLQDLNINYNIAKIKEIIELQQPRAKTLKDIALESIYFYEAPEININNININKNIINILNNLLIEFKKINKDNWDANNIKLILKNIVNINNLKFGDIAIPVRMLVTGKTNTPAIDQVLAIISQEEVLTRLAKGLNIWTSEGL